jgi:hypothetical protein
MNESRVRGMHFTTNPLYVVTITITIISRWP